MTLTGNKSSWTILGSHACRFDKLGTFAITFWKKPTSNKTEGSGSGDDDNKREGSGSGEVENKTEGSVLDEQIYLEQGSGSDSGEDNNRKEGSGLVEPSYLELEMEDMKSNLRDIFQKVDKIESFEEMKELIEKIKEYEKTLPKSIIQQEWKKWFFEQLIFWHAPGVKKMEDMTSNYRNWNLDLEFALHLPPHGIIKPL